MSNIIGFLEQMGRDARLRHATGLELEAALTEAGVEPDLWPAVLGGDQRLLESVIGASYNICCLVNVPEEEEESEEEDDKGGKGKEDEEEEDEEEDKQ